MDNPFGHTHAHAHKSYWNCRWPAPKPQRKKMWKKKQREELLGGAAPGYLFRVLGLTRLIWCEDKFTFIAVCCCCCCVCCYTVFGLLRFASPLSLSLCLPLCVCLWFTLQAFCILLTLGLLRPLWTSTVLLIIHCAFHAFFTPAHNSCGSASKYAMKRKERKRSRKKGRKQQR